MCSQYKEKKLSDGKALTGKNRLTQKIVDTLQNYYGMVIRNNTHLLADMVNAVLAAFYHVANTDENPIHTLCPVGEDSWCSWQKGPEDYKHKHGLPGAVVELLEPLFEELSNADLLAKCLHGKTQNPNKCLNKVIWSRCPKEMCACYKTVQQAQFNDGNMAFIRTMHQFGINPGHFCLGLWLTR